MINFVVPVFIGYAAYHYTRTNNGKAEAKELLSLVFKGKKAVEKVIDDNKKEEVKEENDAS